jgi:hypothetical protein
MGRIIKWLFFIGIIAVIVLWLTEYKIGGKTIQEYAAPILNSPIVKTGIKDIRSLVGEGLKAAGEAISEDVTDSEKKQLEDVLKKEMASPRPIEGSPGQEALPPALNTAAKQNVAPVPAPTAVPQPAPAPQPAADQGQKK